MPRMASELTDNTAGSQGNVTAALMTAGGGLRMAGHGRLPRDAVALVSRAVRRACQMGQVRRAYRPVAR